MNMSPSGKDGRKHLALTVQPGKLEKIELGEYTSEADIPEFSFSYLPDVTDDMSATPHLIPTENGTVRLVYSFQNYGSQVVLVFSRQTAGYK